MQALTTRVWQWTWVGLVVVVGYRTVPRRAKKMNRRRSSESSADAPATSRDGIPASPHTLDRKGDHPRRSAGRRVAPTVCNARGAPEAQVNREFR